MNNVMEGSKFVMREAKLLAFISQIMAGEDCIGKLGAFKVGNAVADNDPLIFTCRETAHNGCFAHAAVIHAIPVTWMRPCNLDLLAAEVAAVAVDMILGNAEAGKYREHKEVDAAACHIELDLLVLAILKQLGKAVTDLHVVNAILHNFLLNGGGEEAEHLANAVADRDLLGKNRVCDFFPSRRVEMFNNRHDIIVDGDGSVKITEDDAFLSCCHSLIPHASIAA